MSVSANGILILGENQKLLIFDCNKCLGKSNDAINVSIYDNFLDSLKEFLYNNNFRINANMVVNSSFDELAEQYVYTVNKFQFADASSAFNSITTFSIDSFDGIDDCGGDFIIDICIDPLADIKLYVTNEPLTKYDIYDKQCKAIAANMESFMLLRTNPKLTGNIKLVVTEDYKLYLDTFKVSTTSILNKHIYRHKGIPDDGNYPYDVYNVFKTVPADEMYRVYDDSYDPHKNYYDSNLQIENIYEYGTDFNNDKLYNENMRILAPLYIGKNLPDYFIIFKTEHLVNDSKFDNMDVFNTMLRNAECVKIFDLRKSTSIGKYLNNYKDMITKYMAGTCSLQFIELDNDVSSGNYRQGRNIWKGISFKKGILTDMAETSYFANQILNGTNCVQEKFNMFLLNGYSRNNILYPNILNLQFMFNDDDAENLTLHNYFGLYLTENDFLQFNQVTKIADNGGNTKMTYYDSSNMSVNVDDTKIKILNEFKYKDRIFFGTTINDAAYLKNRNDFNMFINDYVANMPYNNVVHQRCDKIENAYDSFITLIFKELIHYGEHFKFVYLNGAKTVVYEIVASNDETLTGYKDCISQYIQTNNVNGIDIYRTTFYTLDIENPEIQAELPVLIYRLLKAINKFKECIKCSSFTNDTLAVIADRQNMYFQHILHMHVNDDEMYDNILYFNVGNIYDCHILSDMPEEYTSKYKAFCNNGFENNGIRYSNIIRLLDLCNYKPLNIYEINENIYKSIENISAPLVNTVKGYYPLTSIEIEKNDLSFAAFKDSINATKIYRYMNSVISPYNCGFSIIVFKYEAFTNNDYINICSPLLANVALMGISLIKDLDMYVNNKETLYNQTATKASFYAGEKIKIDGSDGRIRKYITYRLIAGHISGLPINVSDLFTITFDKIYYTFNGITEEYTIIDNTVTFDTASVIEVAYPGNLDNYSYSTDKPVMQETNFYVDPNNTASSKLEMPLVPLVNCQWKSNGIYFDTLSLLNVNTFTNYQLVGNFVECQYTATSGNQYITDKLTDVINANGKKTIIKDFIQYGNYKNAIKKYLSDALKVDTAIGYYNSYVNSLEFIYYGIKFILKISNSEYSNEIKLSEYDNYEIFIVNDYNSLKKNEMYISKNEEFILIVNHAYQSGESYVNGNIKLIHNTIKDVDYNWYNAGFNYDLLHTSTINNILRILKSSQYDILDVSNIKYIVETDLKQYNDFNEDDVYFVSDTMKCSIHPNYDEYMINVNGKYDFIINDTSDNNIVYYSDTSAIYDRYGHSMVDARSKNAFIVKNNINLKLPMTYTEKIDAYMESFNTDLDLKIIKDDECLEYSINESYKPLTLTMQKPNKIKFNHGIFDPNFIDIFSFDMNDEIEYVLNIDTLYANTHVSEIDSIKNVYYNKIMNLGMKCSYNYFSKSEQSPLTTDWDIDLYRLYNDDVNYNDTTGYILGITDKMMFGSKCLVIHDNIMNITNWNYSGNSNNATFVASNHNVNGVVKRNLLIVLNITDSFIDMLMNDKNFISNWDNIGNANNRLVYINNYINNTIMKLYDIKNPDILLYGKYDLTLFNVHNPNNYFMKKVPSELDDFKLINNIDTKFYNQNNKVILCITIQDYENTLFYPIVKINKI